MTGRTEIEKLRLTNNSLTLGGKHVLLLMELETSDQKWLWGPRGSSVRSRLRFWSLLAEMTVERASK
jgi:hypothetical protein